MQRGPRTVARAVKAKRSSANPRGRRIVAALLGALLVAYLVVIVAVIGLRWIDPFTTAVQTERRLAALQDEQQYEKRYHFVPLSQISKHLQHAVIAGEDTRFFQHHGFDWTEVENAVREDWERGRRRGASTITQQLARNLFLSTAPSPFRKLAEFALVPPLEAALTKARILELYLNVVEWGPGVYGADAASHFYFRKPAWSLTRREALELASLLPAPLHRKPGNAEWYVERIGRRMDALGW